MLSGWPLPHTGMQNMGVFLGEINHYFQPPKPTTPTRATACAADLAQLDPHVPAVRARRGRVRGCSWCRVCLCRTARRAAEVCRLWLGRFVLTSALFSNKGTARRTRSRCNASASAAASSPHLFSHKAVTSFTEVNDVICGAHSVHYHPLAVWSQTVGLSCPAFPACSCLPRVAEIHGV